MGGDNKQSLGRHWGDIGQRQLGCDLNGMGVY